MKYIINFGRFGRFFNVPCSVVDKYMRIADGNFVKVLLCVLASDSNELDSVVLAEQSGVKESVVCDAMLFWSEYGIISTDGTAVSQITVPVGTVVKAQEAVPAPAPKVSTERTVVSVRYSPKDLANKIEESAELKYVVTEFEKIKGTNIKENEIIGLINLTECYGFSVQSVLLIIEYCHLLGKDSIAYIQSVARDWFEKGITEYSEVEAEIIRQTQLKTYESKAARMLGITGKLGKTQIEFFDKWQSMGFSIEMLEIAFEKCMGNTNKLSLKYIDSILQSWAGKSIRTPEQVEQEDKAYADKLKNKKSEPKQTSYDLNEWEQFALNFDPTQKRGTNNE